MIPVGHRTYLKVKTRGDNSMFGKAGRIETVKNRARRDPIGMVKPTLVKPKSLLRTRSGSDTTVDIRGPLDNPLTIFQGDGRAMCSKLLVNTLREGRATHMTSRGRNGHLQPI